MQHATQDEETGEYFMGQEQFVDAIAPADEDYVSTSSFFSALLDKHCFTQSLHIT